MAGLGLRVLGVNFGSTGWTSGASLALQNFIGSASQAFAYDASVMASLWQDREMTIPVTAVGQEVRAISDRTGRGLHAVLHSTAAGVPTWQSAGGLYWVDIPLNSPFTIASPISSTDDFTAVCAVRQTGGTTTVERPILAALGPSSNAFTALAIGSRSGVQGINLATTTGWELTGGTVTQGVDYVMSFRRSLPDDLAVLRQNGLQINSLSGWTVPSVAAQPEILINAQGASSVIGQTTAGRLYYLAFVKAARGDSIVAELENIAKARAGVA